MTPIEEQPDEDPTKSMVLGRIRARKGTPRPVAEQLSEALQRKLEHQQALAKELAGVDEELAAKALDVFENATGAAQWLTSEQPILGTNLTPMEYSGFSDDSSPALL
jgi:hypothetical protein